MRTLLDEYKKLEAVNDHTAAAQLLVDNFGTEYEQREISRLRYLHEMQGYLTTEQTHYRYRLSNKYYSKLKTLDRHEKLHRCYRRRTG